MLILRSRCERMQPTSVFADEQKFADFDFTANLLATFALERVVQGLTEFLTAPRQEVIRPIPIPAFDRQQPSVLDNDGFCRDSNRSHVCTHPFWSPCSPELIPERPAADATITPV